jgi:hypothetical protein
MRGTRRFGTLAAPYVGVAGAVLVLAFAMTASAEVVEQTHGDNAGVTVNLCNDELVEFEGTSHTVVAVTSDGSGGTHFVGHSNNPNQGVGESGDQYVFEFGGTVVQNETNGASVITATSGTMVISQGPNVNNVVSSPFHVITDANGVVRSVVTPPGAGPECRG